MGFTLNLQQLKDAYFRSKVLSTRQYTRVIGLLDIFAKHLSSIANKMMLQDTEAEPLMIRRAKAYIGGHHADPIGLDEVANAIHVSTFYFCKMFSPDVASFFNLERLSG